MATVPHPTGSHIDGPADLLGRPVVDENGVDLTQLRANLLLTPMQRLPAMVDAVHELDGLRDAVSTQTGIHLSRGD